MASDRGLRLTRRGGHLRAEGVEQGAEGLTLQRHPVAPHLPVQPERLVGIGARRTRCEQIPRELD